MAKQFRGKFQHHGTAQTFPSSREERFEFIRDGDIVQDVLQHLTTQPGAKARISLKAEIELPKGLDEQTQRIVLENSRSLKFKDFGIRKE